MEHIVYGVIVVLLGSVLLVLWRKEAGALRKTVFEKEAIEFEERRMFGFLHGLGSKLEQDNSPKSIHRYIVKGVVEVVEADGGVLYLHDAASNRMVPVYLTRETPPVLALPVELHEVEDIEDLKLRYRSFVSLSALNPSISYLGSVMKGSEPLFIDDLTQHPSFAGTPSTLHGAVSLMASPMVYANNHLGVLVVTRNGKRPFTANDREVFAGVANQSSFALGSSLIHAEAAEKRRYEREMIQARDIQRVLLPREAPELLDYSVAAYYRPAGLVSGDYYDYVRVDDERYGIAIGDVCGSGIAASLIMAMCRANLRSHAIENLSPASVLHSVNAAIYPDINGDMFVSLLYLILERGSGEITVARAGHEHPLMYRRATGTVEEINLAGMAAGVDQGPVFKRSVKDARCEMLPGDILLLYTDGITEALDAQGDEFGTDRLRQLLEAHHTTGVQGLIDHLVIELDRFANSAAQFDDITLIAIEKR